MKRDGKLLQEKLSILEQVCQDNNANVMPYIINTVRAYGTLGEICGIMRKVFGEYKANVSL